MILLRSDGSRDGQAGRWTAQKVQLTLSQGKKKRGDGVDDEDDVVRISWSQDRVIETLCTEGLFHCTQYL